MAKNVWLDFLSSWRKSHPKVSMKQAMKLAAKDYKKKSTKKKKSKKSKKYCPAGQIFKK